MAHARFGSFRVKLPSSVTGRRVLGTGLVAGGALSFLPVLGIWMLPLGLVVLSADSKRVRRLRRRSDVAVTRWWRAKRRRADAEKKGGPE
ncbi:MAG: hypothetical protein GC190_09550 [Alphaproteobacteria bacterium]|nr:hypothetical protein [Alphaproteobacteria bacterium]